MADELDLAAYLASKGLQVHRAHGTEVTVHCVFCADGDTKGKGKLYLNTETWLWDCKRCGEHGNRKTLMEHFGDEDTLTHVAGADPMVRRRILTEAANLAHDMLLGNDSALEYLLDRGLSESTILRRKYGYVPRNIGLSDMLPSRQSFTYHDLIGAGLVTVSGQEFFNGVITIPYWTHGTVVQLREKQIQGKYRTPGGDRARLYNVDSLHGADDVIVTEGEFDADILEQELKTSGVDRLVRTAVVGLPGGGWPEGFAGYLTGVKRIFTGFDPDETGRVFEKKIEQLVDRPVRKLHLPSDLPKCDWTEYLRPYSNEHPHGGHTWRHVQQMIAEAELAGKRLFSVPDAAAKWRQQRNTKAGITFGFPALDSILRPGIQPGQIVIPLAKTGTGKSVWLSNVVHNLCQQKRRILYVSLELTTEEIFEHLRRIHRFWFPAATEDERDAFYAKLRIVDQNRIGPGVLRELIEEYVEDLGERPEVVIVDYLGYYARGFRGNSTYEKVNDATMELKAVAKEERLAMICPSQVNRGAEDGKPLTSDDARDSGVIEETADFLLSLYRPDQLADRNNPNGPLGMQNGIVQLGILKSRHGGKGRVINLRFSMLSLVIVDALDRKNAIRVDQENTLARNGIHYEDYRKRIEQEASTVPLEVLV